MISSVPLSVSFTVLFAATGCYSLLRWASLRAGVARHHGDQVAELSHVVMNVAMIAMVWAWSGPTGNAAQIVVFTVLSGYFVSRLPLWRRPGPRRRSSCPAPGLHLLMSASMVWMVAAMPLLTGGTATDSGGGMVMDGMTMGGGGSASHDPGAPAPGWAVAVTLALSVALVFAAVFWMRRALAMPAHTVLPAHAGLPVRAELPAHAGLPAHAELPVFVGAGAADAAEAGDGCDAALPGRSAGPAGRAANPLLAALTPRADAVCHLAMSLGMAAMCLLML